MRMPPMDAWGSPFGDWIKSARKHEAKRRSGYAKRKRHRAD